MKSGIKVYKDETKGYVCELWGASTKHPDSVFFYNDWEFKTDLFEDELQIFQWLLYIASRLTFPFYAKDLAEYAINNWYNFC